ncbi:MAG TPA: phosphoadenylyl-sulfate reductase, partial [Burkholderiales bacterium]|nr:phosphoadenylyl-sulfate reductase [Burkholderiales bacterium]
MTFEQQIAQAHELLTEIGSRHTPAAFGTSFGVEDMVLLDLISRGKHAIEVFTLDTGRLPE